MDIAFWVGRGFIVGISLYVIGQLGYLAYAQLKKMGIIDEGKFQIKKYMEDKKNARKSKGNDGRGEEETGGKDTVGFGVNGEAAESRDIQAGTTNHDGGDSSANTDIKPELKQDSSTITTSDRTEEVNEVLKDVGAK